MESDGIATLHIQAPGQPGNQLELSDGQSIKIGRDAGNELALDDAGASRIHASLTASINGVVLADLSSTNGTFVNGNKISSLIDLSTGDVIDIGATKIRIEIHSRKISNSLSGSTSSRAMTAQMKPLHVTVLVVSIVNYHKMSKEIGAEDLSRMLLLWNKSVEKAVYEYDGEIDKIVGSNVVALWAGSDAKQLAIKAAHAALQVRELALTLSSSKKWPHSDKVPWKCTIVLSSGQGLKGVVGSTTEQKQKGFAILGDPIRTAFKLEEVVGKLGEDLIVPSSTAVLVEGTFNLNKVIKVNLKGEEDSIEIFTISCER